MIQILKKLATRFWRSSASRKGATARYRDLDVGLQVLDEQATRIHLTIPNNRRSEHIGILAKTGTGKSSLLRFLLKPDIAAGRGFACFDLHGDLTAFLLGTIAAQERVLKRDLSDKLIVVEPADPVFSVGLNPLEGHPGDDRFVQIVEFANALRERWHLESFGARTDELLRNSLYVLSENGLTLIELTPLLCNSAFRTKCLEREWISSG
jgi:hypothetical protein